MKKYDMKKIVKLDMIAEKHEECWIFIIPNYRKGWRIRKEKVFDVWWQFFDRVLEKIKEMIGYEKLDDTKILIDANANDKLPDDITLSNVVVLMCYWRWQEILLLTILELLVA